MEEEAAKQAAEAEKAARKDARAKEIEGRRSLMIASETHVFEGTFSSFKNANRERLGDLATSLGLPLAGKNAEVYKRISSHFDAHPELKEIPRYASLFQTVRGSRRRVVQEVGGTMVGGAAGFPVHTAQGADFPLEPPNLPGPLVG
ncbi:hypothetical protein FRC12_016407 [Ceratobasidium sp. 428]|nr:hypothetical protein FRC12_016407 [Ceratobasidium sp. 428]